MPLAAATQALPRLPPADLLIQFLYLLGQFETTRGSGELDITNFFRNAGMIDYSASVAEIGANAGRDTWNAACEDSDEWPFLDDEEKREAFRQYVKGFGAWDADEIAAWSNGELNLLCIQMIAGDVRESRIDTQAPNWDKYHKDHDGGMRFYPGDDGRVYFYIGD